jgi:endonuclease/exonuclease/phosphatase family metal-dependent hydrolase
MLLGDLNEWLPLGRPLRWLHAYFGRPPAVRSFPALLPLMALDRIWVRPRRHLLSVQAHRSPASRVASDHLPVTAEISFERARAATAAPGLHCGFHSGE